MQGAGIVNKWPAIEAVKRSHALLNFNLKLKKLYKKKLKYIAQVVEDIRIDLCTFYGIFYSVFLVFSAFSKKKKNTFLKNTQLGKSEENTRI